MTPAYWEQNVYFIGNNDVIKAFHLDPSTGLLSTSPTSQGTFEFVFPGGQPVVSSNGSSNGIVWAVDHGTGAALHAYDATNLGNQLYVSSSMGTGANGPYQPLSMERYTSAQRVTFTFWIEVTITCGASHEICQSSNFAEDVMRTRKPELWKGIVAGAAAGLAASWVMGEFQNALEQDQRKEKAIAERSHSNTANRARNRAKTRP